MSRFTIHCGSWNNHDPMTYHYVTDHEHHTGKSKVVYWGLKGACEAYTRLRDHSAQMIDEVFAIPATLVHA